MKTNAKKSTHVVAVIDSSEAALLQAENIPLNLIRINTNTRKHFDPIDLQEIADSINKTNGVIQPILVRPVSPDEQGTIYEVVVGERRYRGSILGKRGVIAATIREISDEDVLEIQIIENLQRKDLLPLEEAHSYRAYLDVKTKKHTIKNIADKISKSEVYVYTRLQLLNLSESSQDLLNREILPLTQALMICRLTPELQEMVMKRVITYAQFGDEKGQAISCATISKTKSIIKSFLSLKLNKTIFDKKDKTLCPLAGACTGCTKRTGYNKTLFNDIVEDDSCMDSKCFEEKENSHLKNLVTSLTKGKKAPLLISSDYWDSESEELGLPILGSQDWISLEDAKEEFTGTIPKKMIHKAISLCDKTKGKVLDVLLTEEFETLVKSSLPEEDQDEEDTNSNVPSQRELRRTLETAFLSDFLNKYPSGNYPQPIIHQVTLDRIENYLDQFSNVIRDVLIVKYGINREENETPHAAFLRFCKCSDLQTLCLITKEFVVLEYMFQKDFEEIEQFSKEFSLPMAYPEGFVHTVVQEEEEESTGDAEVIENEITEEVISDQEDLLDSEIAA